MHERRIDLSRSRLLAVAAFLGLTHVLWAAAPVQQNRETIKAEPIEEALWKTASKKPVTSAEIDALINHALNRGGIKPAPVIGDEAFIRRAYLDLCGRPPTAAEVRAFAADVDSGKRSKLIDKLLDSDAYARHWARYWYDVMSARTVGNFQGRALARPFERWLGDQLKKNRSWAELTRDMLTATGEARFDDRDGKSGPAFFLGSHMGAEAVVEQAAETARVFMGIQINCAQCHDHPFDVWKREQFHQLAAYFARVRPRLMRDPESTQVRFIGVNLASTDRGGMGGFGGRGRLGSSEYRMPDKEDPRRGTVVHPRSLDGKAPRQGLRDAERRKALVESITSKDNPWFAAAFVNRIWGVLLGQAFYNPVDDLGPQREAVHGAALARLAGAFAGSDYDIKKLFRIVMNTQTYQRESKVGSSAAEHLLFAHSYPTRLRPTALYASVVNVLGPLSSGVGGGRRPGGGGGFGRFGGGGVEAMIRTEFGFDPSLKNDDVEGSIPQALILMNSTQINQKIKAEGSNFLAGVLKAHEKDEPALEAVYLQALSRRPTANEKRKALSYIAKVGKRGEAFEDILWTVINSTEFQTRR